MADQVDIGNDKDYAQMVTKARNKSPFEVKLFIFENQVCHSVLYIIMHLMGLMSWRRKLNIMSPLSLQRELFITPDLNNFFSVLTLNFAFLPQKLMISHSQGFCSLCPAFVLFCQRFCSWDYKVLLTVCSIWWWRGFSLKKGRISIVCQFRRIIFVRWDTWLHTTSHSLKSIQTVCSYLHTDHLCILKLNPHNNNQWQCTAVAVICVFMHDRCNCQLLSIMMCTKDCLNSVWDSNKALQ